MNITIRNINSDRWKTFKAEAVKGGLTLGQALNKAIQQWIMKRGNEQKKGKSLFDVKPSPFKGPDAEHISEHVDEILYGAN